MKRYLVIFLVLWIMSITFIYTNPFVTTKNCKVLKQEYLAKFLGTIKDAKILKISAIENDAQCRIMVIYE